MSSRPRMQGIEESRFDQWCRDMMGIRSQAETMVKSNTMSQIPHWLQNVKAKTDYWGKNHIPDDIKEATATTEDTWAREGNFIVPIFRDSIPKLVNARCESIHANKASSWLHVYKARNNDLQVGIGVTKNHMYAHKRNRLSCVEFTYFQMEDPPFTTRTSNIDNGHLWRNLIRAVWRDLSDANDDDDYRRCLNNLYRMFQTYGAGGMPQSIRKVMHELQDRFGIPRTAFPPAV